MEDAGTGASRASRREGERPELRAAADHRPARPRTAARLPRSISQQGALSGGPRSACRRRGPRAATASTAARMCGHCAASWRCSETSIFLWRSYASGSTAAARAWVEPEADGEACARFSPQAHSRGTPVYTWRSSARPPGVDEDFVLTLIEFRLIERSAESGPSLHRERSRDRPHLPASWRASRWSRATCAFSALRRSGRRLSLSRSPRLHCAPPTPTGRSTGWRWWRIWARSSRSSCICSCAGSCAACFELRLSS